MKSQRFLTFMLIPGHSSHVRRYVIPYSRLKIGAVVTSVLLVATIVMVVGFFQYRTLHIQDQTTRVENKRYRDEINLLRSKVAAVETYLERVKRFDKKLRIITNLEDPERYMAMG